MDARSKELRRLVVRGLRGGKRGHIGSSMSLIEILRVLFDSFLQFKPLEPMWEERDRFILSKGHGCLALYALLADKGFFDSTHLDSFCHFDSILGGHPDGKKIPGVEISTGALGHGMSIAVGIALALKLKQQLSTKTVVVMGDGEINEGSVWEAAMSASKHKLSNLYAYIDYNKLQSYGKTSEVLDLEPLADKWRAFGFNVYEVDGHCVHDLTKLVTNEFIQNDRPHLIICHTVKGKGIKFAEAKAEWHHKSGLSEKDIDALFSSLI